MADEMYCHDDPDGIPSALRKPADWLVGCEYPGEREYFEGLGIDFDDMVLNGPWDALAAWRAAEVESLLGCGSVQAFCESTTNSSGASASISSMGSNSVATNDFGLRCEGASTNSFGIFFHGPDPTQVPFGDGFRCAGGMTIRLQPPLSASPAGDFSRPLDVNAPPANGGNGLISIGDTKNFQLWYRDPMGPGGTGSNTTDAVQATFLP